MATLTITTTPQQDQRLVVAWGHKLGLEGPATAAEIKAAIIDYVTRIVLEDEARVAALAATASNPFTPT
jgi:hypothetical protein